MRKVIDSVHSRALRRALFIGTVGIAASACSSDVTRFSQPLFGGSYDTQYTGSVTPSAGQGIASGGVERRDLGTPGGNTQMAAAVPSGQPPLQRSGAEANGQRTVTVGQGDTVYSIARQNGIPHTALMEANGLSDPTGVRPGQRLVIPALNDQTPVRQAQQPSSSASADRTTAPRRDDSASQRPVASTQSGDSHRVERGETVYSIARAYNVQPDAIVRANELDSPNSIRVGQPLAIPGATDSSTMTARADRSEERARRNPEPSPEPVTGPGAQERSSGEPAGEARKESAELAQSEMPEPTPASLTTGGEQESAGDSRSGVSEPASAGTFRWPVRGRVISAFADSSEGQRNDGVNISVPEGTSVRAAEDGVVAYAGDELEGFGNLVLIRHEGEWVSAYAHNSSLEVQRGDNVTRGQVIAKAGQTGSVNSPQLHFELRQGSQPVDPLQYLAEN